MSEDLIIRTLHVILPIVLIIIGYTINKYTKKYSYIRQGKKKRSFLCHGVALCYEQLELSKEEVPNISEYAVWKIDSNGHGLVQTKFYSLRTNAKGGTDIISTPVIIKKEHKQYAEDLYEELSSENQEYFYELKENAEGEVHLFIGQEITADPTEPNARYYIQDIYDESLRHQRAKVNSKYNYYKLQHR